MRIGQFFQGGIMPRRRFLQRAGMASLVVGAATMVRPGAAPASDVKMGDDGLYIQDWFVESFLDLKEDLETAAAEGRNFAVMFEQRGCPYCKMTHEVNFVHPKVKEYVSSNFDIVQLNLWGSRAVTDFDGEELEERDLARKWRVNFTPTIAFFPTDVDAVAGQSGRDAEIARLPGYFKPFAFTKMFQFVRENLYVDGSFQRYLQEESAALEQKGMTSDTW